MLSKLVILVLCIGAINCETIVGGPRSIEGDELNIVTPMLHDSLNQLKGQQDGTELHLKRIISATVQVVAGKLYNIRAEFESPENQIAKSCKVELWDQPWSGYRSSKFTCDDETKYKVTKLGQSRSKRDTLVGAPSEVDADTLEELRRNITESFVQLQSEGNNSLELKEVFGAKRKIVSGILYTVSTKVNTGDGEKNCDIDVWLKPWVNFREVSVKCEDGAKFKVTKDNRPKRSSSRPLMQQDEHAADVDADSAESHFSQFKQNYGRNYRNANEEAMRFRIFQNNLFLIRQLNKFEQGSAMYGVTDFADLTPEEYKRRTGLWAPRDEFDNEIPNPTAEIPDIELPASHDWREKNAVTPVKNQGNCGSCWAFSVTGNIEGLYAIKSGQLQSFSEQELVDCDDVDAGCNGGLPDNAVKFIEQEGGLEFESDYPYTAHRDKCSFNSSMSRVQVAGVVDFKKKDEEGMAKWLTVNGPISIGINANAMQFYRGGISHPWKVLCRDQLDHGVLIVGYGVAEYPKFNKTLPYWIIKNSWGPHWGEQGNSRAISLQQF